MATIRCKNCQKDFQVPASSVERPVRYHKSVKKPKTRLVKCPACGADNIAEEQG